VVEYLYSQLFPFDFNKTYWIAYSGGIDSHVLLHAMSQLRRQNPQLILHALHVHHGLSRYADDWVEHCRVICSDLNINFSCEYILEQPSPGESIEAWAREARYSIFAHRLAIEEVMLTAHNQDDQAETVLLQLLRGAGPKGLAAMPARQPLGQAYLLRPFLNQSRKALQHYADQHSLKWIDDDSNDEPRFDRNFLRQKVLPVLKERWPEADKNISRSASHCAESIANLSDLAQLDLVQELSSSLSLIQLRALSPRRQRNLLRYWLSSLGCQMPSTKQMQAIQQDLIESRADSQPLICWGRWSLRRYRQNLILETAEQASFSSWSPIKWDLSTPLNLPHNLGQLSAKRQTPGQLSSAINLQELSIRFRQGGERCQPVGKKYSSPLKKLMQEWAIPPWRRGLVPLLFHQDQLAAVIPYCICQPFAAKPSEEAWIIY